MAKRKTVNKGPYIRNGQLIGNGPKAAPVNGSYVKGVEQQRAQEASMQEAKKRLIQNAENSQSHSNRQQVNEVRKLTP